MIVIDSPVKSSVSKTNLKKTKSKNAGRKESFFGNFEVNNSANIRPGGDVTSISSMLFLQEIDTYSKDLKIVDEFAKQSLKHLKNLQLSLIGGDLSINHLYNLKEALNKAEAKLSTPELEQLANDIKIRVEVEIAKIEKMMK